MQDADRGPKLNSYWKYRELMQQWKDEAKLELAKVKPFRLAKDVQRPTEISFRYKALKTW